MENKKIDLKIEIKNVKKLIDKYPHISLYHEFLSVLYQLNNNHEYAYKEAIKTIEIFPFSKAANQKALEYYSENNDLLNKLKCLYRMLFSVDHTENIYRDITFSLIDELTENIQLTLLESFDMKKDKLEIQEKINNSFSKIKSC